MSAIDEAITKHEIKCAVELPKKFVPWTWVVGICTIILLAIGGTSWSMATKLSAVDNSVSNLAKANDAQDRQIAELKNEWVNEIRLLRRDLQR
jgi:hypothetical protein